ncbi:MAG: hypothetical protein LBS27_03805 [Bifidobacteriaceae bacterium]|nr:hypothetical protein [Bifidobacteriaceae bacterium]
MAADRVCNVVLTGVKGVGKTTLGGLLADRLGWAFADLDDAAQAVAAERHPNPLLAVLNALDHQAEAADRILGRGGRQVVATGAEVVQSPDLIARLRGRGLVVHVRRRGSIPRHLAFRLVDAQTGESLLNAGELQASYDRDIPLHDALADAAVDNEGSVEDGLAALLALVEAWAAGRGGEARPGPAGPDG